MRNRVASSLFLLALMSTATGVQASYAQISSPLDVPDLAFWVDAQDVNGTGVQPLNGANVATWVDKSGNGVNLTTVAGTVTFEQTGFDGVNPGLRFPLVARMTGANPFAGNFQNEITVFFVNSNVTATRNFAVSLNGTNQGRNISDGRFSFHTPWQPNLNVFFDAGACCGNTRLNGPFPNQITETTLYTGLNDEPGNRQLLRLDGTAFRQDATGHNANVSRGIHLGDLPANSIQFNGRFAEVVIYERALSLPEVMEVECYLLRKWKPSALPEDCASVVTANKTVEMFTPTNEDRFAVPGNDVIYTITATHEGGASLDDGSVVLFDALPPEVTFFNGDIDDGGPETGAVQFIDNSSGLTFDIATDLGFSNLATLPTSMADCVYSPLLGYDPAVRFVCFNPSGSFGSAASNSSFSLSFRARIN